MGSEIINVILQTREFKTWKRESEFPEVTRAVGGREEKGPLDMCLSKTVTISCSL